ncbi:glutathione S-transferase [Acidocella aquatica]|uniref:Glutathione S-transferase n=2 Tax=Acidocella aquatica TaxID=1922313 RepID=A0ABQ6A1X5_9PROT|nr:glutathione S-transferase [Acidocella aquatica]
MAGKLYLGTRRYSSWSLRGWLMVRLAGIEAEEIVIPLAGGNTPAVKAASPSGMVPYLEHEGARVWESLAIAEYCAEINPALWPGERIARAHARAIAAEMHGGFRALRLAMPMNLGRSYPGLGQNTESLADIARVDAIWSQTRDAYGASGPYLFGAAFNAADAMFAPVVARLLIYQPPLSAAAAAYCEAVRAHPLVAQWYDLAAREPAAWRIEKFENLA